MIKFVILTVSAQPVRSDFGYSKYYSNVQVPDEGIE